MAMTLAYSDLGDFLSSEGDVFCEDMRNYSLIEVMESYQAFKRRTLKDYSIDSAITNVKKIEEKYGVTIMPNKVSSQFYKLMEEHLLEQGLRPSTISKYFQHIRTALAYSRDYGCRLHPTFDNFDKSKYERDKVALTPDEVSHIYHYDLSRLKCRADLKKTLDKVRDMFCLSCCLGQRYSDMIRICPEWFDETKTIMRLRQQKTNNLARIDIPMYAIDRNMALNILRKYNYYAPYTCDLSDYARYLKKLIKLIGQEFDTIVRSECKVGSQIVVEEFKKSDLISSHTARRTFVSVNVKRGKTEQEIRRCTGHKSTECFSRYVIYDD